MSDRTAKIAALADERTKEMLPNTGFEHPLEKGEKQIEGGKVS